MTCRQFFTASCVCFLQYEAEDANAMVFCDVCNVCVHQVGGCVALAAVCSCMLAVLYHFSTEYTAMLCYVLNVHALLYLAVFVVSMLTGRHLARRSLLVCVEPCAGLGTRLVCVVPPLSLLRHATVWRAFQMVRGFVMSARQRRQTPNVSSVPMWAEP